jgi:hypothetical protein
VSGACKRVCQVFVCVKGCVFWVCFGCVSCLYVQALAFLSPINIMICSYPAFSRKKTWLWIRTVNWSRGSTNPIEGLASPCVVCCSTRNIDASRARERRTAACHRLSCLTPRQEATCRDLKTASRFLQPRRHLSCLTSCQEATCSRL